MTQNPVITADPAGVSTKTDMPPAKSRGVDHAYTGNDFPVPGQRNHLPGFHNILDFNP